ncbi:hypothetical protein SBRCBS47491_009251 [Sporothrix bragantina]|uniref:C2H2-type domain-containing protein n=1 Tax=Sporothrix bragantina TaxID=671064 RepID=A0ABP0CTE6_9PEZI
MADVRALLRQQRTQRRIDHPHAVYSDSGKLSCAVCGELVRPESAWDDHLRGALHRQNVRALHTQTAGADTSASPDLPSTASIPTQKTQSQTQTTQKRRHSETEDDGDVEMGSDGEEDGPSRKKQHRPSMGDSVKPTIEIKSPVQTVEKQLPGSRKGSGSEPRKLSLSTPQQLTPPLGRRSSGTPAQGVEMSIPSRPATPIVHRDSFLGGSSNGDSNSGTGGLTSAASTPKIAPLGRSPLIPHEVSSATAPLPAILPDAAASASGSLLNAVNGNGVSTTKSTVAEATSALGISQAQIDEDEWAAFEAEVVNAPTAEAPRGKPDMNGGLVASAGAVSAEDLATAGTGNEEEDERAKRRAAEEAELEDEKAEATRALVEEFEDMQELESRVQKLKEKREALRNHNTTAQPSNALSLAPPAIIDDAAARRPSATMIDKENIRQQLAASHSAAGGKGQQAAAASDDEEDDEDEDEEDADWDAFRFK